MDDDQLQRYSRHILLPEIDLAGQERLLNAAALIVGMGGLGAPAAIYLASSGVGRLTVSDGDRVDLGNLQRQIIYTTADIGRPKVVVARAALSALNPGVTVTAIDRHAAGAELHTLVQDADVVIDASDNFATRFAVNAACVAERVPLITGAVIRMAGQVTVFRNDLPDSPCLRCLYPELEENGTCANCEDQGVLAPVAGMIGTILAVEALKLLLGIGENLYGRVLLLDAAAMTWRTPRLTRDPHCPVCALPARRSIANRRAEPLS